LLGRTRDDQPRLRLDCRGLSALRLDIPGLEHAGVGIGTVYRHFPTKEALLTEMVRVRFQEFAAIAALVEDTVDPLDALETVMRRSAEAVDAQPLPRMWS
jgi:AcrR family transcriptional regulator